MSDIYTSGEYLERHRTWHAEDSLWKAEQIIRIISNNGIHPATIAEVGCGAGAILGELSRNEYLKDAQFKGYDISPQAIAISKQTESKTVKFFQQDPLSETNTDHFDALLVIDVFEHIPDYMGFLQKCKSKAEYKVYHIPLSIHVSSVLRNAFIRERYSLGHLHYFTADSAICTLKDTGHEIVDHLYTNAASGLFKTHPSIKKAIANAPRWLFSKFSLPFTARVFGGYSLLVLAR